MAPLVTLFLSGFTSATLLPGTSEALLLALLASGGDPVVMVVAASCGNVLGSIVNWLLGRYVNSLKHHRWFPVDEARLTRAEGWFKRFGVWLLLMSWLPVVGDPLTVAAGALRVGFWRFVLFVSVGKTLRYGFLAASFGWWFSG